VAPNVRWLFEMGKDRSMQPGLLPSIMPLAAWSMVELGQKTFFFTVSETEHIEKV
jgi:hypothetical protein